MNNTLAIDLQALCCPDKSGVNTGLLSGVLQDINSIKQSSLLFREEVCVLFDYQDPFISTNIWALLSEIEFKLYDTSCLCSDLTTKPEISNDCTEEMKAEIALQCSFFHRNGILLFLGFHPLWKADKKIQLMTVRDKKAINHPTCVIETLQEWKDYLATLVPCLVQLKHISKEYQRGNIPVSPFSSYDIRNEQPAKDLLRQAYEDYQGKERFPKHLYTWDSCAGLYVKFNNSGQNEYHGYDLKETEWSEIPLYVRNSYHH